MKVFRKELYKKAMHFTEEECVHLEWPLECDGVVVSETGAMNGRDGIRYRADEDWCEEVTDLDCQSDVDAMKEWEIGTEHVIRKNGKDVRVVVSDFEIGENCCSECAASGACYGRVPCTSHERTTRCEVYLKEVKEHKPLVLNLFFSPERNMTFTEHPVNPEVGFEIGKYYRSKRAVDTIKGNSILDGKIHKCLSVTKSERPSRDCNAVTITEYVFTFDNSGTVRVASGQHDPTFSHVTKLVVEMRPLVVMQEPDIIEFDELCKFDIRGSLTGEFTPDLLTQLFEGETTELSKYFTIGASCGKNVPFEAVQKIVGLKKEKPNMKVDENFTFVKKIKGATLHTPKVVKTHKAYANYGACEACGAIVQKGDFVLTANETMHTVYGIKTIKTHRLCANCTAEYIKATSGAETHIEKQAEWVARNNAKKGTRVRVIQDFEGNGYAGCITKKGVKGKEGTIVYIHTGTKGVAYINVMYDGALFSDTVPYYALEVVKEPSYAERQAQWIKDNNVKEGVTIRITKGFGNKEDDSCCCEHLDAKGKFGVLYSVRDRWLELRVEGKTWSAPYTALEVVSEEPTFADRQRQWVKDNDVRECTKLRIVRAFTTHENGCITCWNPKMGATIGKMGTVRKIDDSKGGVLLQVEGDGLWWYPYFVLELVEEPTYAERQAEWVSKNNVKSGTKVRFTRGFNDDEDGSYSCRHADAKGHEGTVQSTESKTIWVTVDSKAEQLWACPYFALEVIPEEPWFKIGDKVRITIKSFEAYNKVGTVTNGSLHKDGTQTVYLSFDEFWDTKAFNADKSEKIGELYVPKYRPFKDAELNSLVGKLLIKKGCEYPYLVTSRYSITQVAIGACLYNAEELLRLFTLDGKPCGVEE